MFMCVQGRCSDTSIREHAYKVTEELLLSDPYNEQVDKEVWVSWHYFYIV
jgi:hypothetical protein